MPKSFIHKTFGQTLRKASRMPSIGKLLNATRLIQRALMGDAPRAKPPGSQTSSPQNTPRPMPQSTAPQPPSKAAHQSPDFRRTAAPAANDAPGTGAPPRVIILPAPLQPAGDLAADTPGRPASFTQHQFKFESDTYPYRLFVPSTTGANSSAALPLVVLLHGCKQDALDFSNGTAMNSLAQQRQAMVLYPEQITRGNAMRCWNWFEPGHQQADRGEPGMIAALTQQVIQQYGADPQRVYIAGLSAGGAMAAVMAGLHPELFAAVGVHSGLAAGAARDMMSAFSAMRSGAKGRSPSALPTIIFHGTADTTVHPNNSGHITDAALAGLTATGLVLVKTQTTSSRSNNEKTERVVYSTADGKPYIENWRIDAGVHAWSGGNAAGSYTDPDGPSASAAMLAFFLQHRLPDGSGEPGSPQATPLDI